MSEPLRLGRLDGDGIGPEVVPVAVAAVDAALDRTGAAPVRWAELPFGGAALPEHGCAVPAATLDALAGTDGWIVGPHDSASYPAEHRAGLNPSGTLRKHFGLWANVRPARAVPGAPAWCPGMDLVVVRENTEGFYADRNMHAGAGEFSPTPDVALAVGVVTRPAVRRIARLACELARARRGRLTIVHKANVLPGTMGLFRDECRAVAGAHGGLEVDDVHVDAMTVHLLRRWPEIDVVVTENMFGDILSDLTGELAGSVGGAGSVNESERHVMAQAAHGSAPDIAGRGVANPVAMVRSAAMLLERLAGRRDEPPLAEAGRAVHDALDALARRGTSTADAGGSARTGQITEALVEEIRSR